MDNTIIRFLILIAVMLLTTSFANAESDRGGWYGGLDLGIAMPGDLDTHSTDTDVPTNCDQHFNNVAVDIDGDKGPANLPFNLSDPKCARGQDVWENNFDLDNGPLLGLNVGHSWSSGLRLEAEYFYRQHDGEDSQFGTIAGGKDAEFSEMTERLDNFHGHQFFGNVYYDFHNVLPKAIPYIGGGIGVIVAKVDYSAKFHRNSDPEIMKQYGRHPDAAGTLTSEDKKLSDSLWGYQLMAGIDYPLTESLLLGVKVRYVDFSSDFKDGDSWDKLRGHESTIEPGGAEVRYKLKTDDLDFWGVSLNLKHFF